MGKEKNKIMRVKDVIRATGFHRGRLKLWEKYGLLIPIRAKNKNKDRLYTKDDVKFLIWADKLMKKEGLSAESIKILKEYFETGKITSYRWHKEVR